MILTGDSFILAHGFSSENLVSCEVKIQRQESRELRPRSLDSSRSLALYDSNVNSGDHIPKKETKIYSSALAEVCPVRERDIRRLKKCIKEDVRHVKELNKFNNNGMIVLPSLSRLHVPRFLQPLANDRKELQAKKMNQQWERAFHMTKDDLKASTTKNIPEQEQLDEESYKDHLCLEVLKWLHNMPILFSRNFTREYLRDNVVKGLVESIERHTLEASSGFNETQLKNEIDNCVNSLPMRLPNNQEDSRLFKNGLKEYILTNIIKLCNKIFVKRDEIENKMLEKKYYIENKLGEPNIVERKGLKEYDKYGQNREISEKNIEGIEIEIKSTSNFRKSAGVEIKQDKVEEVKRWPTNSTNIVNNVDDLYEKEINIWLDRMNYNKIIPRELTVKLIIEKIMPFLKVPVYSISYKLKCSGAIIDMFEDLPIKYEFPIELIHPRIKTVYLNRLAVKLAKRLMIVKVNSHLKELSDIQQCDEKYNIYKKPDEENLQARVKNKGVSFENLQVTETKRLIERQNDSIHDIQKHILNEINDDYMRVKAQNIAKDEDKLEAWTAKLLEEQKNMILECEDLLKLSKALVYERLSFLPCLITYEKEILDWVQNLPLLPLYNEPKEQRKIMKMICKLSEKISKRDVIRSSNLNADKSLVQYITDWISNLALDPRKPIVVLILIQQLMNRIDEINRKDDTTDVSQLVQGKTYKRDENAALSIVRLSKNWCNTRPIEVKSANIKKNMSAEDINKEIVNPAQYHRIPSSSHKEPGDLIVELVEDWCSELPIIGDQLQKQIILDYISTQVVMKICELNMDSKIFNNDLIYDQIFDKELSNIMSNLPASVDLRQSLRARKYKLLQMIEPAKTIIKERKQWLEYETKLDDTVTNLFNHCDTKGKDEAFNKLKHEILDNFVLYFYNYNDAEAKLSYKNNLLNLVNKYIADIKDKGEQVDPVIRRNQLLCELSKILIPNNNMLKEKVLEIKMKHEVERLFKENGLNDNTNKTFKIQNNLAKILNNIEKSGHTECNDKKMNDTVVKYLKKLDKNLGSKVIYNFVNHLKYNEAARKTPPRINQNNTKTNNSDTSALLSLTALAYPISSQQQTAYKPPRQLEQLPQNPSPDPSDQTYSYRNKWYPSEPQSHNQIATPRQVESDTHTSDFDNTIEKTLSESPAPESNTDQRAFNDATINSQIAYPRQFESDAQTSDSYNTYERKLTEYPLSSKIDRPRAESQEQRYSSEVLSKIDQTLQVSSFLSEQTYASSANLDKYEDFKRGNIFNSTKLAQDSENQRKCNDGTTDKQIATPHQLENETQTSGSFNTFERTRPESATLDLNADQREFKNATSHKQIATPHRVEAETQTSNSNNTDERTLLESQNLRSINYKKHAENQEQWYSLEPLSQTAPTPLVSSFIPEQPYALSNYLEKYEDFKRGNLSNSTKLRTLPASLASDLSADQRACNDANTYKLIAIPHQVEDEAQTSESYNAFERTLPQSSAPDLSPGQRAFSDATTYKQIAIPRRAEDEAQTSDPYNAYERTLPESSDLSSKTYRQQSESIARKLCDSKEQMRKSQELSSEENYLCFCDRPLKKLCSRMYCVIPLDNCKACGGVHPNRCSRCRLPRTDYVHCTWDSR